MPFFLWRSTRKYQDRVGYFCSFPFFLFVQCLFPVAKCTFFNGSKHQDFPQEYHAWKLLMYSKHPSITVLSTTINMPTTQSLWHYCVELHEHVCGIVSKYLLNGALEGKYARWPPVFSVWLHVGISSASSSGILEKKFRADFVTGPKIQRNLAKICILKNWAGNYELIWQNGSMKIYTWN